MIIQVFPENFDKLCLVQLLSRVRLFGASFLKAAGETQNFMQMNLGRGKPCRPLSPAWVESLEERPPTAGSASRAKGIHRSELS